MSSRLRLLALPALLLPAVIAGTQLSTHGSGAQAQPICAYASAYALIFEVPPMQQCVPYGDAVICDEQRLGFTPTFDTYYQLCLPRL